MKRISDAVATGAREHGSIDARVRKTVDVNGELAPWRITSAVSWCRLEDFNDAHALPAGAARQPQCGRCLVAWFVIVCVAGSLCVEACAGLGEVLSALAISEQSVMADAMEAMR